MAVGVHKAHIELTGGGDPIFDPRARRNHGLRRQGNGTVLPSDPHDIYDVAQWLAWQLASQGPKLGEQAIFEVE